MLWTTRTIGPKNPHSFPPGPSDSVVTAILTYGSADEVARLLGDDTAKPAEWTAPDWAPEAVGPGKTVEVVRHYRTQGFMDAVVMTIPALPDVVIVEKPSS